MTKFTHFLKKNKYEILLFALLQHLFIGIFLNDLPFYTQYIWPLNMVFLGIASVGVFHEKGKLQNIIRDILFLIVLFLPIGLPFFKGSSTYFLFLNFAYVVFFLFILLEVFQFLLKPSYINKDIISASACGYLLLLEIGVFLFQFFFYQTPNAFKGIDTSGTSTTYIDLVYFCSITLTSIGYGDITPNTHTTKLLASLFGIIGQFYSVVLVGIIISKFTSNNN